MLFANPSQTKPKEDVPDVTWINDVLEDSAAPARARRRSIDEMARVPLPKLPVIGKGQGIRKKGRKVRKLSVGAPGDKDAGKGVSFWTPCCFAASRVLRGAACSRSLRRCGIT